VVSNFLIHSSVFVDSEDSALLPDSAVILEGLAEAYRIPEPSVEDEPVGFTFLFGSTLECLIRRRSSYEFLSLIQQCCLAICFS
jgi:hypothetical protein